MACSCQKIGKMGKRKHKVGAADGAADDLMEEIMEQSLPGLGVIAAHEIKSFIPATLATSVGTMYPWLVNGAGILAGIFVPTMIHDEDTKKYLKPLLSGVAAQCMYSLFLTKIMPTTPPVVNRTWNTYALGKPQTYALGKPQTYALGCTQNADGSVSYTTLPGTQRRMMPGGSNVPTGQNNNMPASMTNPMSTNSQGNPTTTPLNPVVTAPVTVKTTTAAGSAVSSRRSVGGM